MEVSWLHLIPLLPLVGAAINGLAGRWIPKAWVYAVALLVVLLSFLMGVFAWVHVARLDGEAAQLRELVYTWFSVGRLRVDLGMTLDRLSGTLVLVVTGVGFLIHLYSVGYMDEDPAYWRYFSYLNLFVASMLLLVLADNLVAMFVGWEGVGLCSYLLIGFWYDDEVKAYAGRKAFVVNRIGDFGFLIGIFVLYHYTGQTSFAALKIAPMTLGVASAAGTAHLITHAFFKACLFLGSGAVIHGLHGEQDMARMGGLRRAGLKHTALTFCIATVAITGVLPISGFFSKDEILAQALNTRAFSFLSMTPNPASPHLTFLGPLVYLIGTLTAGIT